MTPLPNTTLRHWHLPSFQIVAEIAAVTILAGIAARFLVLVLGLLKLRQLRHRSSSVLPYPKTTALLEQAVSQVKVGADFRLSPDVDTPVTFGFTAPIVLLPQSFPLLDSGIQAAIACHELFHVRRCDWAHHLAEEAIRACLWFHPAIAWLIAQVRLAREQVVDFDVVAVTNARKTYLKALLEFTAHRACAAAVPAPLFLAERQLTERIALMLKEVRMSKTRMVISLTAIACCIVLSVTLASWTLPLKGAPLAAQLKPIHSSINGQSTGASVDRNSIWIDTVKSGPMALWVRGAGTIVRGEGSRNSVARVTVHTSIAQVHTGERATVNTGTGFVKAHVVQVNEGTAETVSVDLGFDRALPAGMSTGHAVDATINAGELNNVVLWINRPARAEANVSKPLFRIVGDGAGAERVNVKFGRASAQTIEVLDGLKAGDKVILSDMSDWEKYDRIRLK